MSRRRRALLLLILLAALLPAGAGRAQSRAPLYFLATGHHLSDDFGLLSFWEASGGEPILGLPLTEPFEEAGRVVQYLERSRLEYDLASGAISLGLLGVERTRWRTFAPAPPRPPSGDSVRFAETGHTLSAPFKPFWDGNGGVAIFGFPISEPLWESSGGSFYRVQYFERARLEHHPVYAGEAREVEVSTLGLDAAEAAGLSLAPVAQRFDALALGEARQQPPSAPRQIIPTAQAPRPPATPTAAPAPPTAEEPAYELPAPPKPTAAPPKPTPVPPKPTAAPPPPAPGGPKLIEIDLSRQWLYAYEGGTMVFSAPVATGKDGFNTPTGDFAVYYKVPIKTMRGNLGGESWEVPDVPSVMFIWEAVAIHGAYWHNLFGSGVRISHGCINMRVDDAAWLYEWAPLETAVTVHY